MLSDKEIQKLFDFARRKRVRYKDVQIEIVDHLATAIEALQKENTNLTFDRALEKVYADFGLFGFAKIVQSKETAMHKFWQNRIFKKILSYYKLPRLIGTVGSSYLFYIGMTMTSWLTPKLLVIILFAFSITGVIWIMYKNYQIDTSIRDYLYVKSYYGLVGSIIFLFFQIPNIWMPGMDEPIFELGTMGIVIVSLIIPFSIVMFYICLIEIPKELSMEFNERFGHYLEFI